MPGLIFGILIIIVIGCVAQIGKNASVPKCKVCKQPRAVNAKTCPHCGDN